MCRGRAANIESELVHVDPGCRQATNPQCGLATAFTPVHIQLQLVGARRLEDKCAALEIGHHQRRRLGTFEPAAAGKRTGEPRVQRGQVRRLDVEAQVECCPGATIDTHAVRTGGQCKPLGLHVAIGQFNHTAGPHRVTPQLPTEFTDPGPQGQAATVSGHAATDGRTSAQLARPVRLIQARVDALCMYIEIPARAITPVHGAIDPQPAIEQAQLQRDQFQSVQVAGTDQVYDGGRYPVTADVAAKNEAIVFRRALDIEVALAGDHLGTALQRPPQFWPVCRQVEPRLQLIEPQLPLQLQAGRCAERQVDLWTQCRAAQRELTTDITDLRTGQVGIDPQRKTTSDVVRCARLHVQVTIHTHPLATKIEVADHQAVFIETRVQRQVIELQHTLALLHRQAVEVQAVETNRQRQHDVGYLRHARGGVARRRRNHVHVCHLQGDDMQSAIEQCKRAPMQQQVAGLDPRVGAVERDTVEL